MNIRPLIQEDIKNINLICPEGWGDISPYFRFYINNPATCFPFVVEKAGRVIGSGNYNYQGGTAWLSHIIVVPEFREHGIGKYITEFLLAELAKKSCHSIMLIATPMGEPVYKKLGFKTVSKYIFLKRTKAEFSVIKDMRPLLKTDLPEVLELDRKITGEDRSHLMQGDIEGWAVQSNTHLRGFYLSKVWDGPVMAEDPEAGLALLGIRMNEKESLIIPEENTEGINFLMQNGFYEFHDPGMRMYNGENVKWKPEMIYGRIGGAFG
jgi:GNAT superfamily N-acetyltransferase